MSRSEPGRTICLICDNTEEMLRTLTPVLLASVSSGARVICVLCEPAGQELVERLTQAVPGLSSALEDRLLNFPPLDDFLPDGRVTPTSFVAAIREFIQQLPDNNRGRRILILDGEWLSHLRLSDRQIRSLMSIEIENATVIFEYDRARVASRVLALALQAHPLAMVESKVVSNPFHLLDFGEQPPESVSERVDQLVSRLRETGRAATSGGFSFGQLDAFREDQPLLDHLPRLMESVAGSLVSIDLSGTIHEVNSAVETSMSTPREELIGKNVWALFPEAVGGHTYQQIQRVARERTLVQFETFSSVLGHWIEVTLLPNDDQIWMSIRDISRRKRIEQTLNARVRQQAAVAELGQEALTSVDLRQFMENVANTVRQTLEVEYVKILEILPDRSALRLVAGVGWKPGLVGVATVGAGMDSQAGYTLRAGGPVIVEDLKRETRFNGPELLREHGVVSGISVVIPGSGGPFGVLGAHTSNPTRFTQDDVNFVQSVANVLAAALDHARSEEIQRHYAAIVASSDEAIIGETLDGLITGWNAAAERMFGYSAEEVIGQPVTMLYPEEFRHESQMLLDDIRHGRRVDRHESVRRTKDGRLIDVSISLSPIRDATGSVIGASKIAVDNTAEKRAELERIAGENRLQLALEAGRMGTWDWNLGSDEVQWSANMEHIHGLEPGTFGGSFDDFRRSIHPEDEERVLNAIRRALVEGEEYYVEYRNLLPDGRTQWLEARGRIVSGGRGRPDHMTGVCTDVTEEVVARQQIARFAAAAVAERDRLQQVVDVIPEGISITDPDGRIVLSNRAARDIWGQPPPDEGWGSYTLFGFESPDGESKQIDELPTVRSTLHGERVVGEQLSLRNASTGELVPLLVNSAPIRNDGGQITGAVTTFQDITAFKEFERQKDEFLQTLSHDLKNPLTSVKGNAQFLRRRALRQGLDLLPVIDRIENSAVQAVELIDELLDLTRLQMGRPVELVRSRTNVAQLVSELADQQAATSRFHRIRVETKHHDLIGHLDEMRVARVLSNLLDNAIKYSPDNSEIVIEVDTPPHDAGWVEIRVIDRGIGIPKDDLPLLFERFRRGSNVEGQIRGSGLGLASSKQIVEQHGGCIQVESVEGEGSTFTVLLPLQPQYVPR